MTVTVTAATFTTLIDDDEITAAIAEAIIDQAIDALNLYLLDDALPNLSGTTPNKSATVESFERGAIINVALVIYKSFYKSEDEKAVNLGPAGIGAVSDLMSKPQVIAFIQEQSKQIWRMRNPVEVSYG